MIRTFTIVILSVVPVLGCGDGSGGLPDPGFLLRGATAASGDISSAHLEMSTSGAVPGLAARALSADVVAPTADLPGASAGTAEVSGMHIVFVERNGEFFTRDPSGTYTAVRNIPGGGDLPHPSAMLDPERGLSKMLENLRDPRTEAREEHEGVLSFRVTGTVPESDAEVWLPEITGDPRLTVWFAANGRHLPVGTRLETTGTSGAPVSVGFVLSELNTPVEIPETD